MDIDRMIEIAKENNVEVRRDNNGKHYMTLDGERVNLDDRFFMMVSKIDKFFDGLDSEEFDNIVIRNSCEEDMINYVAESYSQMHNCNHDEAISIICNSSFMKTLSENPTYVMHYDDEYWAKKIHGELGGKDEEV